MYIGILRVHNDWREERSSLDPKLIVKMRQNNARRERERGREGVREQVIQICEKVNTWCMHAPAETHWQRLY